MSSLKYWVWLASAGGVGPVAGAQLLKRFGTPEMVFLADPKEYREIEGARSANFSQLALKNTDAAGKILESCQRFGYRVITIHDAQYPERLRNIYDPPLVMYIRGNLPVVDDEAAVAVVGTRNCTPYGITTAENIGCRLARRGLLVVTGLARGIDSSAARGALKGGGRVLGVIGSGIDVIYPAENKSLFDDVAASGAIISEYPPGTPALPAHFPARNRILSGLSLGVAVIEAPKKSGALITASRALEQGRDVFTLPGNVGARSCEGSNALLRDGAIPVLSAEDIISEYEELFPDKIVPDSRAQAVSADTGEAGRPAHHQRGGKLSRDSGKKEIDNITGVDYIDLDKIINALSGDEKTVAETIGTAIMHVDEIIVGSSLSAQQVLTALTMLEINGYAAREGSGKWRVERG